MTKYEFEAYAKLLAILVCMATALLTLRWEAVGALVVVTCFVIAVEYFNNEELKGIMESLAGQVNSHGTSIAFLIKNVEEVERDHAEIKKLSDETKKLIQATQIDKAFPSFHARKK